MGLWRQTGLLPKEVCPASGGHGGNRQCGAEKLAWSLCGEGCRGDTGPFVKVLDLGNSGLKKKKAFPSQEDFHLIPATITKITFTPQLFLPSSVGSINTNMS